MGALRRYRVVLDGGPTMLRLTAEDAARRGLGDADLVGAVAPDPESEPPAPKPRRGRRSANTEG